MQGIRSKIIPIGNSKGVRIPAALLRQSGISGDVELEPRGETIIIRPTRRPRQGWEESCRRLGGEDEAIRETCRMPSSSFDQEEWEW